MRRLLESLMPDGRQIYWKWVGGMFALYVVLMGTNLTDPVVNEDNYGYDERDSRHNRVDRVKHRRRRPT
jgi:hypothetical protein